jgi:hypothetical protein
MICKAAITMTASANCRSGSTPILIPSTTGRLATSIAPACSF